MNAKTENFYLFLFIKLLEFIRDGQTVEQIKEIGNKLLGKDLVQIGIDKVVKQITIEANFRADGQKTVN